MSEASTFDASSLPAFRLRRPFRLATMAQLLVTLSTAAVAAYLSGSNAFLSAVLGGAVGIAGLLAFAFFSSRRTDTANDTIRVALRAEAAKIVTVVLLLWTCFSFYAGLSVPAFFIAFILSILLSGIAFAVADR